MLPRLLGKTKIQVAGVNSERQAQNTKEDFYLLKKRRYYLMRELPQNKRLLSLNVNKRSNDYIGLRIINFIVKLLKRYILSAWALPMKSQSMSEQI